MKSNFNRSKRWMPKTKRNRTLFQQLPSKIDAKPTKPLDMAKILEAQKKVREDRRSENFDSKPV